MPDVSRHVPWGTLLFALAILILRWRSSTRAARRQVSESASDPAASADELRTYDRARALFTTPDGHAPDSSPDGNLALDGGAMEERHAGGTYLLVALADGRVALYVRGGPSAHGLGAIPEVRRAAEAFRASIQSHAAHFLPESGDPEPEQDAVVVRARTERGCVALRRPAEVSRASEGDAGAEVIRRGHALRDAVLANLQ